MKCAGSDIQIRSRAPSLISGRIWLGGLLTVLLAASLVCSAAAAEPKRVLLLLSFGRDFRPWNEYATQLRSELNKQSAWPLDIIEYSLVSARSGDGSSEGAFVEYLRAVFGPNPPDLIIGIGAPAGGFVQQHREQLFKSTPLLITAIEERRVEHSKLTENDTVVAVHHDFRVLFENILRVLPDTKNIVAVNGVSPNERFWKEEIARETEPLQSRVTITWSDDLPFEDVLKHAAKLPPNSAIFLFQMQLDAAGVVHEGDAALRRLYAVANAPIFSTDEAFFGRELVGGPMHSVAVNNERAAGVAVRLLGGERAGDIKLPPSNFAPPKFDWRELQRWHISESRLPPDSEILFRPPTVWEQYRWQSLGVLAALLAQLLLISWLVYEHRRRSLAEVQSRSAMAQLAHLNRLETAGQLSASIAHEINQPITGIALKSSAALRWLAVEKPDVEKIRSILTDIVAAAQRTGDIVSGVRALFKKDSNLKAPLNLNKKIDTVLALLRLDLQKGGIQVETTLEDELPAVTGDPVQIQQVILNLIVNAAEAMQAVQPRALRIQSKSTAGTIRVTIEDTGPGINESDRTRIFDPLFTTKAGGMGMGLSICRSIIENHGGKIWAEPGAIRGTVFQFELPVVERLSSQETLAA
jgi:signal transduction histidine kinase